MELAERGNIAKKYQTKSIVLQKGQKISTVGFKDSIAKIKKMKGGYGYLLSQKKKYIDQGYIVLNTNL